MARILICDDERNLRELLTMALESCGHHVGRAAHGGEALALLKDEPWDLVITDLKLPDLSGLDVLRAARTQDNERPVVLITAYASTETAVTAMKEGAFDYLEKPFPIEDFHLVVTRALEQWSLQVENLRLKEALREHDEPFISRSPTMRRILELVKRVARSEATVLITGESGTGKELVARSIHQFSNRAKGPFVAINCGAIPETLIESELFGHDKGAFSGAVASRKGVFVEADGGTLLLDEIGEMPTNTQVKLLRVLQERMVRAVGGSGERRVDVRVVATTNRALVKEVAEGRFREDLYYRINVVNLHLPPLRERKEDIPLLATHFIERATCHHHQSGVKGMEPEVLECLLRYSFPGNVRELENMVEGAVSMALGERLDLGSLPPHVREPLSRPCPPSATLELPGEGFDLEKHLMEEELRLIRQALERTGGNKTRAAELLGLSFRSFRYRLSKLALEDEGEA